MIRSLLVLALLAGASAGTAAASPYRWPLDAGSVTAHYDHGNVTDWRCGNNTYANHRGTDIGVPRQTQVYAAQGGWVKHRTDGFGDGYIGSTDGGGFGNAAALYHGNGDETIYGHMSAGSGIPALGATLDCAAPVGRSGTSGNSSGPHLHFETRVGVDEAGSYYSGAADDPYAGACGGPISFWRDQGNGMPSTSCGGPPPPVDDAAWVADVTIPDGTELATGTTFVKIWRVRNTGTSTWGAGYTLEHVDGPAFGASAVALAAAAPGDEIAVSVTMTADGDGTQRSSWQAAKDGAPFGQVIWVEIVVATGPDVSGAEEACDGIDSNGDGTGDDGLVRTCCETGIAVCAGDSWGACSVTCDEDGGDGSAGGGCDAGGGAASGFAAALSAIALLAIRRAAARSESRIA